MIGEIRDRLTMQHTLANQAIKRILNLFPEDPADRRSCICRST